MDALVVSLRAPRRSRLVGTIFIVALAALSSSCGGGRPESPESLAREVFEAIRDGDLQRFLGKQALESDYVKACPGMTAMNLSEARLELAEARTKATESFMFCRDNVRFDGAEFLSAARNPTEGMVQTMRFTGCLPSLNFPAMRVLFMRNGVRGNVYIQNVVDMEGRWVHRNGVNRCEQSVPR